MEPKRIYEKDIYISWMLIGIFALFFIFGIAFNLWLLIGAAISIIAFLAYSSIKLKCPECGQGENLLRRTLALKRPMFCYGCGKLIEIFKEGDSNNKNT